MHYIIEGVKKRMGPFIFSLSWRQRESVPFIEKHEEKAQNGLTFPFSYSKFIGLKLILALPPGEVPKTPEGVPYSASLGMREVHLNVRYYPYWW